MAKTKTAYVCTECGADHSKWQGQCVACGEWNTLKELKLESRSSAARTERLSGYAGAQSRIESLSDISLQESPRKSTGMSELDRVLGGGLVAGAAILLGGQPGAGKSTLLLQIMSYFSQQSTVLYVTGEESLQQVAMRASRLGIQAGQMKMLTETNVETIVSVARDLNPAVVVVDSIQVMYRDGVESAPGSVSQVRESAAFLTQFAKQTGTVLWLVGHVTKDGSLAGPKVLEHMIDCSLMLEGEQHSRFRTLRGVKNRFGAVNELGIFAMLESGLKEVKNPSAIFLSRTEEPLPGSVVTVLWEGTRPLLVEIQALADESFAQPRRVAVGLDQNRLVMLLAVLHRHGGLNMGDQDVFANVVGGVKVSETSADLAVVCSVISTFRDQALPKGLVVFGEIGLSGEIRPVANGQERVLEAQKHGFTKAIVPKSNVPRTPPEGMEVVAVSRLSEVLDHI
ncbi:MAG: DNA repair protein RadA [Pseudomonadales bacterium]|nr:DNA repair protein RadA [Pseudomonadales bacterium]